MSDPYVGEIQMGGYNFAPRNFALCWNQILPIQQNTALFSLLGTNYGGNGTTTFALPDLRGRAPAHAGHSGGPGLTQRTLGELGGEQAVTLLNTEMPSHTHSLTATTTPATSVSPQGNIWAVTGSRRTAVSMYTSAPGGSAVMHPQALGFAGSGLPHNNLPPYLGINFYICLYGIFPARN